MDRRKEMYLKILLFAASLIYVLAGKDSSQITRFLILILILALNAGVRLIVFKRKMFLLSMFLDFILVYNIFQSFGGITYILIFAVVMDEILYSENYAAVAISILFIVYLLYPSGYEAVITACLLHSIFTIFTFQLKQMRQQLTKLEYLYDDVRRYSYELENTKNQLEGFSRKVEELTQLQERSKISEEIHDTIGHRLTALLLQLEAGIRVIDVDKSKGKELLNAALANLRESLEVLRETVRSMKPKEYKNIADLIGEMLNKFQRDTGTETCFKIEGIPFKLFPGIELTLYKNVQEALTNAVRHGKADSIEITLSYSSNEVSIVVKDNGIGCKEIKRGMGLSGMEERLKVVGGELRVASGEGFTVESSIPI